MKTKRKSTSVCSSEITMLVIALIISIAGALTARAKTESQIPGEIRIARWDVILNDNGLESVDSTDNSVVHTTSVGYSGAIFNADALRAAVNAAQAVGGLEGGSQSMAYTQIFNGGMYNMQPLYFNYYQGQDMHVGLQGNAQGNETYENGDSGHIHVKLDYPQMNRQLMERTNGGMDFNELRDKASIVYDGQLNPGDALAFSATFKARDKVEYRHMIVWEAFKAQDRYQQNFQNVQDSERWCQMGPKTIRDDSDVALVWSVKAKHPASIIAAKWEQKLEDGKVVRLIGITRTDKWLYCWWDADGQPIDNHDWISLTKFYQNQSVWFSAELTGPPEEWKKQTPTGKQGPNRGEQSGSFRTSISTVSEQNGQATVGVAVGPWEQVGEIKKGGRIKIGTATYRLLDFQSPMPDYMYAQFFAERGMGDRDSVVALSAVEQNGTEVDENYFPAINAKNWGMSTPNFQGVSAKNVKTFHVWKRKQQWVTFSGFATEPLTPPKDHVTAAEVTAAVDLQNKSQQQNQVQTAQQQLVSVQAKRKEWDAIPADPKTPRGALRLMFQLATNGDLKGVRARMKATQPDAGPMLDAIARMITSVQSGRRMAIARFGEANVNALQSRTPGSAMIPTMIDMESAVMGQSWTPRADGGLQSDDIAIVKGDRGEFYLDFTVSIKQKDAIVMISSVADRMDQLNQLMKDNPSLTIDQLRKAIAEPATQPTTKP